MDSEWSRIRQTGWLQLYLPQDWAGGLEQAKTSRYSSFQANLLLYGHSRRFSTWRKSGEIVLVVKEADLEMAHGLADRLKISKVRRIVHGGRERQDSVYNGLKALDEDTSIVVIHDGARPLVERSLIRNSIVELRGFDGVVAGVSCERHNKIGYGPWRRGQNTDCQRDT